MTDTTDTESPVKTTRGNKRKAVRVTRAMVAPMASVESLTIENMVLEAEGCSKAHFKRLKYKGCPVLAKNGEFKASTQLIDMERDDFVREMYCLFKPSFNPTKKNQFNAMCDYIGWIDDKCPIPVEKDYFANSLTKAYMEQYATWVSQDKYATGSWSVTKGTLSAVLKLLNRHTDAMRLVSVPRGTAIPHKTLHVGSEFTPTVKALFRAYKGFKTHMENGTAPDIHPIWDEVLFKAQVEKQGWSNRERAAKERAFKTSVTCKGDWRNQLTRIAAMLCFMFTGMNTTPMLKMKRKEVVFTQVQGGKYIFDATKGRAKDKPIDNAMGFSPYAKGFIESWLSLSEKITGTSDEAPLFPYITGEGEVIDFVQANKAPQLAVNKLLKKLGLTEVTPSILRKTKIDTLMKVTENVYIVSISANNEPSTIKKNYSAGNDQDHARNLSASTEATYNLAKGTPVEDAVSAAKFAHPDVLSEYDYKKLREKERVKTNEAMTPLGVRCQDNTKGAAGIIDKILKKNGVEMPDEEKVCTDFLGCFECEYHKLVAGVEDIWLMLSFKDTLDEMQLFPSVNSLPKSRYENICLTISSALARYKEVSNENYSEALEKKKGSSHPLYASMHALNDLLEVFS